MGLSGCDGPPKNGTHGPILEFSKFWSNLNWRFGDPMQEITHQILTGHLIDLKLVANQPGWILMNLQIPHARLLSARTLHIVSFDHDNREIIRNNSEMTEKRHRERWKRTGQGQSKGLLRKPRENEGGVERDWSNKEG